MRTNIQAENTYRIHITCYAGAGNSKTFSLRNSDGSVLDLSALTNAVVTVEATKADGSTYRMASTDSEGVVFVSDALTLRLGLLELPEGVYYPKVTYTSDEHPLPITLMGKGWTTEICLKAY
jgi:hypothetical protein